MMFKSVPIAAAAVFLSVPASASTYYFSDQPAVCCASYNASSSFAVSGLTLNPGDVIDITLNFKNGARVFLPGTNFLDVSTRVGGGDTQSTYYTSFTTELLDLSATFPFASAGTFPSHYGLYASAFGGYGNVGRPNVTFAGVHQRLTFQSGPSFNVSRIDIGVYAGAPEPAAWAMMLVGFGAIGGSIRRARRCQRICPGLGV
jgi:hypothetical protein